MDYPAPDHAQTAVWPQVSPHTGSPSLGYIFEHLAGQADDHEAQGRLATGPFQGRLSQPEQAATTRDLHDDNGDVPHFRAIDQRGQLLRIDFLALVEFRTRDGQFATGEEGAVKIRHGKRHAIRRQEQISPTVMRGERIEQVQLDWPVGQLGSPWRRYGVAG